MQSREKSSSSEKKEKRKRNENTPIREMRDRLH